LGIIYNREKQTCRNHIRSLYCNINTGFVTDRDKCFVHPWTSKIRINNYKAKNGHRIMQYIVSCRKVHKLQEISGMRTGMDAMTTF
jgi:hypothetical protein